MNWIEELIWTERENKRNRSKSSIGYSNYHFYNICNYPDILFSFTIGVEKITKKTINIEELNQEIDALSKRLLSLQELKLLLQKEESIKKLVNKPKIEAS